MESDESMNAERENYVRALVYPMSELEMLGCVRPEDEESGLIYRKYNGALACVFGLPLMLVGHLANLDHIRVPSIKADRPRPNYIQLLTQDTDSILNLLSYLCAYCERYYDEPWQHSEAEKAALREAYATITEKHTSAVAYLEVVSARLWQPQSFLQQLDSHYYDLLSRRIRAYRGGVEGYIFSHVDEKTNKTVYVR